MSGCASQRATTVNETLVQFGIVEREVAVVDSSLWIANVPVTKLGPVHERRRGRARSRPEMVTWPLVGSSGSAGFQAIGGPGSRRVALR